MKFTFPLSAQIALILALNIATVILIRFFILSGPTNPGIDSLFYSPITERLQFISFQIHHRMREVPEENREDLLNEYGHYYNVNLNIFDPEKQAFISPIRSLPREVEKKIAEISKPPPPPPPPPHLIPGDHGNHPPPRPSFVVHSNSPSRYWVGVMIPLGEPGGKHGILLADTDNLWDTKLIADLQYIFLGVIALFGLSLLIWLPFIYFLTAALRKLTVTTEKISEGKFDIDLDIKRADEIGSLSRSISKMSSRLNNFVHGQKRFLGDIAHELTSPIARQQVAIELLENKCGDEEVALLNDIKEESVQMSALVNELLAFSKAGLNEKAVELKPVELVSLVDEAIKQSAPTAPSEIDIRFHRPAEASINCLADEVLVSRILGNILRNAIKYAGVEGPIEISIEESSRTNAIVIRDHGPGVPQEAIERLGEPFYRPDLSRSREAGGAGLGLAIVKTCVESCQGGFRCRNLADGGLEVKVEFKKERAAPGD